MPSLIETGQAVLGMTLLYMAFFLHEKEERQITERLGEWWIHVDDAATAALAWHTKLFRVASERLAQLISFLFGERLITAGAFWTAMLLSGAVFVVLFGEGIIPPQDLPNIPLGLLSFVFVLTAILPAFGARRSVIHAGYPVLGLTWMVRFLLDPETPRLHVGLTNSRLVLLSWIGSLLVGGILFLLAVGALRTLLVLASRAVTVRRQLIVLIGEVALVWAFLLPPSFLMDYANQVKSGVAVFGIVCLSLQSLSAGMTALSIAVLHGIFVLLFLLHRLFWPILQRPLYAAHRHRILENHQLLATAGALLLMASGFSILRRLVTAILQPLGVRVG